MLLKRGRGLHMKSNFAVAGSALVLVLGTSIGCATTDPTTRGEHSKNDDQRVSECANTLPGAPEAVVNANRQRLLEAHAVWRGAANGRAVWDGWNDVQRAV